jgi:alkylated DNA nucleotide flippase Atl1
MAETVRSARLITEALQILRAANGKPLSVGEVLERINHNVEPTAYEQGLNRGDTARWITTVHFLTGDAATIGWMTKRGGWSLTEAGDAALDRYRGNEEELLAELIRRYREIRQQRKAAQATLDEVQQFIADVISLVSPGTWTSHADLADLAGTTPEEVAHFLASSSGRITGSYRVLTPDGAIPEEGMLHADLRGTDLLQRLENEGLEFRDQLANPEQRLSAGDLVQLREQSRRPELDPVQRAWSVRNTSSKGESLLAFWLTDGIVSLSWSLGPVPSDLAYEVLQRMVGELFGHASYAVREQRLTEFDRFIRHMRPGDLVVTTTRGNVYLGRIAGDLMSVSLMDDNGLLVRKVEWLNIEDPLTLEWLDAPLPALLQAQDRVGDLTAAVELLRQLADQYQPRSEAASQPEPPKRTLEFVHVDEALAKSLHLDDLSWLRDVEDLLWQRKQIILYGPPGTGKTYLATRLARHLAEDQTVKLIQFHPSYTYEDFIEGYRPQASEGGAISFALKAGPFRQLAEDAQIDTTTPYILIIDEINRANLAKVFGELYFLLEYRKERISLQYTPADSFTLPENLFIIGTMNTSDRSIALPDAAMRRRFAFFELHPSAEPTRGLLQRWMRDQELSSNVPEIVAELNRRIEANLPDGRDHVVGPSYFMHRWVHEKPDGLDRVWRTDVMPLVRELTIAVGGDVEEQYGLAALRRAVG